MRFPSFSRSGTDRMGGGLEVPRPLFLEVIPLDQIEAFHPLDALDLIEGRRPATRARTRTRVYIRVCHAAGRDAWDVGISTLTRQIRPLDANCRWYGENPILGRFRVAGGVF